MKFNNLNRFWYDYAEFVDISQDVLGRDLTHNEDLQLFANFLRTRFGLNPLPNSLKFQMRRDLEDRKQAVLQ